MSMISVQLNGVQIAYVLVGQLLNNVQPISTLYTRDEAKEDEKIANNNRKCVYLCKSIRKKNWHATQIQIMANQLSFMCDILGRSLILITLSEFHNNNSNNNEIKNLCFTHEINMVS